MNRAYRKRIIMLSNTKVVIMRCNADINALSAWCGVNGIKMNIDKTKTMSFGTTKRLNKLPPVKIDIDGDPLQTVTCYKYLGVTLDGQLNFGKHAGRTISNDALKLKQFRRMRPFLTAKAAMMVYKNMLLPMIEYGDVFLTGATLEYKRKLQVLQNKGLRCALGKDLEAHIDDLHSEANLWKLKYRREMHLYNLMFDKSKVESNLRNVRREGAVTRASTKKLLKIARPRTEKFKKSLSYRGPKKWNNLPVKVQTLISKKEFKTRIRALIDVKRMDALDLL